MSTELDHIFRTGISTLQKVEWFEAFIKVCARSMNARNIQGGWCGAGIYPMNPARVLDQFPPSASVDSLQSETGQDITPSFNDTLLADTPLDATVLHSANTALVDLLHTNQALNTPARKYIPRLASTAEWLLAENTILHYEVKRCQEMLGARKQRGTGKRLILKGRVVISIDEVLVAIEAAEKASEAKKSVGEKSIKAKKSVGTGRPQGRPKKNQEPVIALEDGDEDLEIMEHDCGEPIEIKLS